MTPPAPGSVELTATDLEQYTSGRLKAVDAETGRLLAAALSACRSYCDWHVCPIKVGHQITLDGPGSCLLVLPTLRLQTVTAVTEKGVSLDVSTLEWSARGLLRKADRTRWTNVFGGIAVTMTHGFDNAADFQSAVLELADRMSREAAGGQLVNKKIDDIEYQWAVQPGMFESALLDGYRLDPLP